MVKPMNLTTLITGLFLLVAATPSVADVDPLFASHDVLEVEIAAPFAMLADERPNEEEAAGKFRYSAEDGTLVEFDVAVRTRGRLRRGKETCTFPPLRLNFKKSQTKDTLFDKQDKVKLVTHCRNKARSYEQAVIAEYLTYRILGMLTDRSFSTRLLRITYVPTDKGRDMESYAILIESKDRLQKRLDAKPMSIAKVEISTIRPEDLNLASVFQFFIGNTDFSPVETAPDEDCCHNQVLFVREGELSYSVPYDFDQSGLVDAPHAFPNPRFRLKDTRERLYRGRCVNIEHLPATLRLFRERRDDIESLIQDQPGLDKVTKRSMLEFTEEFYDTIDSPKRLQRNIVGKCL
jgi:hypothetical protein